MNADCQRYFESILQSLIKSVILEIADQDIPLHVFCDASDFAIGCPLIEHDADGAERVYFQTFQLHVAERRLSSA